MINISKMPFLSRKEEYWDLVVQKLDVTQCYPKSITNIYSSVLDVTLNISDSSYLNKYSAKIIYTPNKDPISYILSPEIKPSPKIHMYPNLSLCLYDPCEIQYRHKFSVAREIIPWTIKWIHYYEVWMINGNDWIGPETPHGVRDHYY